MPRWNGIRETPTDHTILVSNHLYRWRSIWYMCTIAFDCILYYLKNHEWKNTKNTTLQEFQAYITSNIEEFISPNNNIDAGKDYSRNK